MIEEIRNIILQFLENTDTHPTAEELFIVLKNNTGKIDKEIYQEELDKLEEEKKIISILALNNLKHYDFKTYQHFHFICDICGKVRDVFIEAGAINMLKNHAQRLINSYAKINKINLSFQGICHDCRKNNKHIPLAGKRN